MKEELRVRYAIEEGVDTELDKALIALLKDCGWHFWASGCHLNPTGERDLAFDREEVADLPE